MSADSRPSSTETLGPHWHVMRHLPVTITLIVIGLIYAIISDRLSLGPRGLLLALIIPLVVVVLIAIRTERFRLSRGIAFVLLGLITTAEAFSTVFLIIMLISVSERSTPHSTALGLLRDSALIWIANILTFALWYWELDAGGPSKRHREGYQSTDFVFPQLTLPAKEHRHWCPQFVDYLFLAFNTSTAFSPTDTLVLSHRAKLLSMTQAIISLVVLAIIAARAINTL